MERTREALLQAAIDIAEEDGVGAIGLREAARRAGLTHGAPYRHFEGREALVAAVAEEGFRALLARCMEAQAGAGADPLARFQALGVGYFTFAISHPGQFRVMFGVEAAGKAAHTEAIRTAEAAVFALAVNAIASAQRAGAVDAGDPQEMAMLAWSSIHGLAVLVLDGLAQWVGLDASSPEKLARRYTSLVFDGLRPRKRRP